VNFFFDNNLSPKLARSLHILVDPDHRVIHLKNRFPADTADTVWMQSLATEPGWFIVTADIRISKNPHELKAWQEAGHTVFFLKPGWLNLDFWTQAWKFNKCFPELIAAAGRSRAGSAFLITTNGKIELI